jgi:flagellar basal body rod protein FlgG
MGIFGALTTSVTGMRAQSFALENISGNIANSQTTAFKRIDTLLRLKTAVAELKAPSGDTGLDTVLAEIDLRVEVELAKAGIR